VISGRGGEISVKQNDYIFLGIWVAVIAIVFLFLWRKGYLARLATYIAETREELRKCTWPSWDELKGSTVVVMISILILGVFTVAVDFVMTNFVSWVVLQ
jgi:preprotein translocase subunit SecE